LPLSAILHNYLEDFVLEKRVVFTKHPMPNKKTQKIIDKINKDIKAGKNIEEPFGTVKEFMLSIKK